MPETTITKTTATVSFSEVEPLINQALQATNSTLTEVLRSIGYDSSSSVGHWRKSDKVPVRAKYALIGLLSELRVPLKVRVQKQFDFDELAIIFAGIAANTAVPRPLKAKIAKLLAEDENL